MKKLAMIAALAAAAVMSADAVEMDGVVAKVDDHVILRSEVLQELRSTGRDEAGFDKMRVEMIDRLLILKAAKTAKLTVEEWRVDSQVREIINRGFGGDRNQLLEMLQRQKISYDDWRAKIKENLMVMAMQGQMVARTIHPSPRAMREEYEKHPERYTIGRRVTVSVILLKPEDVDKRAAVAAALKDEPFGDVARRYSCDGHAAEGGVWKEVDPEKEFRPEVCDEIGKMPTGTMSRWLDLDGWSFLLRKDADDQEKKRTFAEAYEDIEQNVRRELYDARYAEWIDKLRRDSYIKIY